MSKPSIASQLEAIQKQRDLLSKKEAALKAESHGKVLTQIVKMAKDAGLTLAEITQAYQSQKKKLIITTKTPSKMSSRAKSHTMKGVKLPAKYMNPLNPMQTWTGRGVDPAWVAKLRETGLLETALIQVTTEVVSSTESLN
jgi:DNA-binding protein H-NS